MSYKVKRHINNRYDHLIKNNYVKLYGLLSPEKAIKIVQKSDFVLVIAQPHCPTAIASKFYEYCAAEKTVIAVGPDGDLKKKIEENNVGNYFFINDIDASLKISDFLKKNELVNKNNFKKIILENSFKFIAERIQNLFK